MNFLRVISAFAVVMIHVLGSPFDFCESQYSDLELFVVRYFRNVLNWSVPVFVMISWLFLVFEEAARRAWSNALAATGLKEGGFRKGVGLEDFTFGWRLKLAVL